MDTPPSPELLPVPPCLLGEGPLWDSEGQRLWWVDILGKQLHSFHPGTQNHAQQELGEMPGSLALCGDGRLLLALQSGFYFFDPGTGRREAITDPESHLPQNRFNDGKCDPKGRFWAGTMAIDESDGAGSLYCLNHQGEAEKKLSGLGISNGMAWSPDQGRFYFIDSPTREVRCFDYDPQGGRIAAGQPIIRFQVSEGYPDGMAIDREGMLWIAQWDGWKVSRWDPGTGQRLGAIPLPVAKVSSCCFGGSRHQDLFITTARKGLTPEQLAAQPLAGCTFVVRDCGFEGIPPFLFQG